MMPHTEPDPPAGPYAAAVAAYWAAGWRGLLPLPRGAKWPPPDGWTGNTGGWPSWADVYAWAEDRGDGNLALRLPHHVVGVDVDAYDGKAGATTLAAFEQTCGPLPATWRTTSRDDGISGIRLYRVPEGLRWPGEVGAGIEIIRHAHRYAVAPPSRHPTGSTYRWIGPDGVDRIGDVPPVDELPDLPPRWVQALTGGREADVAAKADLDDPAAAAWLADHDKPQPCRLVATARDGYLTQLANPGGAARHEIGLRAAARLARLAGEGHPGAVDALSAVGQAFTAAITPDRGGREAEAEWRRLLVGAVQLAAPTTADDADPCSEPFAGLIDPAAAAAAVTARQEETWQPTTPAPLATTDNDAISASVASSRDSTTTSLETPSGGLAPMSATESETPPPDPIAARLIAGGTFILDVPDDIPTVWGDGDAVLWAEGEALMLVGPPGVGKTTLTGQLVRSRLGLGGPVLGHTVIPTSSRVLYLAMDRPAQIRRALRRIFADEERAALDERVVFWPGPPPADIAKHPETLIGLAHMANADTVIIDSLKDAAIGLSEDEVAAGYNRARQAALTAGVQVLELHHMTKRGGGESKKPTELADVYGSAWLSAGAGSVILLWGAAGDPVVDLLHLKQPAEEVGPFKVEHDHAAGVSSIFHGTDLLALVRTTASSGLSVKGAACRLFDTDKPSPAQVEKARRRLDGLVSKGLADKIETGPQVVYTGVTEGVTDLLPPSDETVRVREGNREALTSTNTPTRDPHVTTVRGGSRKGPLLERGPVSPVPPETPRNGHPEVKKGAACRACGTIPEPGTDMIVLGRCKDCRLADRPVTA